MAYWDFKHFPRRTASDKVLHNKAFDIAKNPKYNGYQGGLASIVYKFFDKKAHCSVMSNQELAEELHKPIIKKLKKNVKVYSSFEGIIWGADLADSKYVIVDSKYAWFVSLKDKKVTIITDTFQKILDESKQMGR